MKVLLFIILVLSCGKHGGNDQAGEPPQSPGDHTPIEEPTPLPPVPSPPGVELPPVEQPPPNIVEKQQYIFFHNLKRCWHNVENAAWDDSIAQYAKYLAMSCKAPDVANTSSGTGSGVVNALDAWYMEFLQFPFGSENGNAQSARFSRMVWKETNRFGCGSNTCPQGFFVVCRYAPPGNLQGQYDKNVFQLKPDFMKCNGG